MGLLQRRVRILSSQKADKTWSLRAFFQRCRQKIQPLRISVFKWTLTLNKLLDRGFGLIPAIFKGGGGGCR